MTNLDVIGAVVLTASAAIVFSVLVPAGFSDARARFGVGGVAAGWFTLIVVGAAVLFFDPRLGAGVPALGVAVAVPVILGVLLVAFLPRIKAAVRAIPLPALIAVHTVRVVGVLLVLLYLLGRLPGPFAPVAGFGDIAIGVTAPLVAWFSARRIGGWRGAAWLWNGLGLLDLLVAIGLGIVSADGSPIQLIFTTPNTSAMTNLPWILLPGFLVPLLMLIHFAVFDRLAQTRKSSGMLGRDFAGWASRLAD
jgi:hypothetical protein